MRGTSLRWGLVWVGALAGVGCTEYSEITNQRHLKDAEIVGKRLVATRTHSAAVPRGFVAPWDGNGTHDWRSVDEGTIVRVVRVDETSALWFFRRTDVVGRVESGGEKGRFVVVDGEVNAGGTPGTVDVWAYDGRESKRKWEYVPTEVRTTRELKAWEDWERSATLEEVLGRLKAPGGRATQLRLVQVLGVRGQTDPRAVEPLADVMFRGDSMVRWRAVYGMARLREKAMPVLGGMIEWLDRTEAVTKPPETELRPVDYSTVRVAEVVQELILSQPDARERLDVLLSQRPTRWRWDLANGALGRHSAWVPGFREQMWNVYVGLGDVGVQRPSVLLENRDDYAGRVAGLYATGERGKQKLALACASDLLDKRWIKAENSYSAAAERVMAEVYLPAISSDDLELTKSAMYVCFFPSGAPGLGRLGPGLEAAGARWKKDERVQKGVKRGLEEIAVREYVASTRPALR